MPFVMEALPGILLFMVAALAVLPAIEQGRMLLLGTAAFFVSGAYGSAWLISTGWTPNTLAWLAGGVIGASVGLMMGLVCLRLRKDYFALATLCFAELLRLVLRIEPPFPGPQGISGVTRGSLFGLPLTSQESVVAASVGLLCVTALAVHLVSKAPWAASLQAARDNERAARTIGLPVDRIRITALVFGGFWCGLAGALSARHISLADGDTFALTESIMVIVVVLLAGGASVARCLFFGFLIGSLAEGLRFVASGAVKEMAFGALLFVLALLVRDELKETE